MKVEKRKQILPAQTERRALLGSSGFDFSTPSIARRSKRYDH
jgi:hypothetical protein